MNITNAQTIQAAAAGVRLLSDDELRVPIAMAMSDNLLTLKVMLASIASGEVVVANPQNTIPTGQTEQTGKTTPPLKAVDGDGIRGPQE